MPGRETKLEKAKRELREELNWRISCENLEFESPNRDIAKRHLLEFVRLTKPSYTAGWFHRELCHEMEEYSRAITEMKAPRLLVTAPPRHGKSEIVSRKFPVFHLGNNPEHEVILATYGQELANEMSGDARRTRDDVLDLFPLLAPMEGGKDGVEWWDIEGGGNLKATGVGGPLTGRGAHHLGIDDPFKNEVEADSEIIRESKWGWFRTAAFTRLAPGGGIMVMHTRWHLDDILGRALEQKKRGEVDWKILNYPAIAEEDEPFRKIGEALDPARYPLEALREIRAVLDERSWNALYLQRPVSATGGTFQRDWLKYRFDWDPQRPPHPYTQTIVSVDATFKKSKTSDMVTFLAIARHGWSNYYILDRVSARMSYVETREKLKLFCRKHNPNAVVIEEKANGAALIDDLRLVIPTIIPFNPDKYGDKKSRAELSTPIWQAGQVSTPTGAPWVSEFNENMASFPHAKHDDDVDTQSQAFIFWQPQNIRASGASRLMNALESILSQIGGGRFT
ncbi:MAG: phage terminase large subunit [Hyphomicrobium sp.]|nr:phage terminase large subunit [Hyphomicrobium sp.]